MRMKFFAVVSTVMMSAGSMVQAQGAGGWEFDVTPYAWLSGLSGDVGTIPGLPPAEVDLSFGDIVDDLDFGAMLLGSARKGPWVVYLDTTYANISTSEDLGGLLFDSVAIKSKTTTFALALGRTVAETSLGSLETYVGARAWWLDNRVTLTGAGGGVASRGEKADWIDPLIGVAGRYMLSDRWTLFGALEVGGFGVGADSEWSVLAGASYHVSERFSASFGWRHLEVDYDEDGVLFDVAQSGPVLGATFRF